MSELSFTPCCHGDAAHQPLRMPNELWLLPCPCAPRGQREGPLVLPGAAQREPARHPHLFPSATAPANLWNWGGRIGGSVWFLLLLFVVGGVLLLLFCCFFCFVLFLHNEEEGEGQISKCKKCVAWIMRKICLLTSALPQIYHIVLAQPLTFCLSQHFLTISRQLQSSTAGKWCKMF